jgi:hypothetical protein
VEQDLEGRRQLLLRIEQALAARRGQGVDIADGRVVEGDLRQRLRVRAMTAATHSKCSTIVGSSLAARPFRKCGAKMTNRISHSSPTRFRSSLGSRCPLRQSDPIFSQEFSGT